jgi:hypothetical protein
MEKVKKYFEFSGTISGLNYFLRQLLASVGAMAGGFALGYGVASDNLGILTLGLVLLVPAVWMSMVTIYKRCEALFPGQSSMYTTSILVLQVLGQFVNGTAMGGIVSLVLLIVGLYLIFKNSDITEHNG